jgi:small subunit ribosomal protein S7
MSRRKLTNKRTIEPEVKYSSLLLSKFINKVMKGGKKSLAEKIVYDALLKMSSRSGIEPLEAFNKAIDNIRPQVQLKSIRLGGANYQVPRPIDDERSYTLAARWIIAAAFNRSEKSMTDKLCGEMLDASNKQGSAFKKREDTHKMAEANKAFAHLGVRRR